MENYFGIDIIPSNESARLQALRRYEILDTPPEGAFNKIAELAAKIFDVPIALVSLVDEDRVWVKANTGLPGLNELSRGIAPCSMAILQDEVLEFADASEAVCMMKNPLVAGDFGMRFYAGAPLHTLDGYNLGTFCIIDKEPKVLTEEQKNQLQELASIVMDEIELRLSARKAVRLQRELLGIAAHDMKNPLGGIKMFAELIKKENAGEEVTELADTIKQASTEILHLIEDLLKSNSIEDGNLKLNLKAVNLAEVVEQVVKTNQPLAKNKEQELSLHLGSYPVLMLDQRRMREVIDNLVSNAIKYSPHGERIEVVLHEDEQQVRLEVIDKGPGLTEDDKQKLFGKFQRLSARPTGNESSTGLGLAIVKMLVELHGGHVGAHSNGPGTGSNFYLHLPKQAALTYTDFTAQALTSVN